ncbi:DUF420 domain-containing protein [Ichthyenterobacterium sp. W332]|uniref:DUF420 domain-containing protein n=1 Tax=Microcosmobacter mediterraneus TaxID=3075607 RepID=A0ABU2YHQ8_9FLAO|nr:DUF420 domain-containing protein [Ichthyenterobacterium sp. W332]MDT0557709.1 DUF420 domain-containing protein [Ichthyenterobacterium sp. W332]
MNQNLEAEKKYNKWVIILSIVIPVVVAILFKVKIDVKLPIFLPPIYATINGFTALLLIIAFVAIKKKNIVLHENLMTTAIWCSVIFLVMYVLYHMTSDSTVYEGNYRTLYLVILISHILLSVAVIPFVLITYVRAITKNFERHKKIAKITFPLWLYVAVSGVVVYLMISPYYT